MAREPASPIPEGIDSAPNQKKNAAEEFPPLLQMCDDVLTLIANKLDAKSFLNLANSCRRLRHFCQLRTNGVQIRMEEEEVEVFDVSEEEAVFLYTSELAPGMHSNKSTFDAFVESLARWPFAIHLKLLEFLDPMLPATRALLTRLRVRSIREIILYTYVPFDQLSALIRDYNVKEVFWRFGPQFYTVEESTALLNLPLDRLEMERVPIWSPDDVTIPSLCLFQAKLTPDDLSTILKKFLDGDGLMDWRLEHYVSIRDLDVCLQECLMISANYPGPLPSLRPLAVYSFGEEDDDHKIYHVLRQDGRIIQVSNYYTDEHGGYRCFYVRYWPLADAPAILSRP